MTHTLIEFYCRGCDKPFYIDPNFPTDTCHSCKCFESAMQHMMEPREWERAKPKSSIWRVVFWAMVFVAPFWVAFYWLVTR